MQPEFMNRLEKTLSAFSLVCCVFLFIVHFRTALSRGPLDNDEGFYLNEAKSLVLGVRQLPSLLTGHLHLQDLRDQVRQVGGLFPPLTAKQTFTALMTAMALLTGNLQASPNLVSLLSMAGSALVLYRSALMMSLRRSFAIGSAAWLFCSPVWGYYGVSSFPNALAGMFLLSAVYFYLLDRPLGSAFLLGLALTTHYGTLPCVGLSATFMAFNTYLRNPGRKSMMNLAVFTACLVSPMFFWELVYRLFEPFARHTEFGHIDYRTYLQQFFYQIQLGKPSHNYREALRFNYDLFHALAAQQGWLTTAWMALSHLLLLLRFGHLDRLRRIIVLLSLTTLLVWSCNLGFMVARASVFILPFLYLASTAALPEWDYALRNQSWLVPVCLISLIGMSARSSYQVDALLDSPYPKAVTYLTGIGYTGEVLDPRTISIWQFYLHRQMQLSGSTGDDVHLAEAAGDYFKRTSSNAIPVISFGEHFAQLGPGLQAVLDRLNRNDPAMSWAVPYGILPMHFYENCTPGQLDRTPVKTMKLYWLHDSDLAVLKPS